MIVGSTAASLDECRRELQAAGGNMLWARIHVWERAATWGRAEYR